MLDWPAFGDALWLVSDQLGIRPEWQLPVLHLESGFDPAAINGGGCVGLNQLCPGTYENYVRVPVSQYRTWSASQQLAGPVMQYWRAALSQGQIRSATRLMLAQLGTALLNTAPSLSSSVYAAPSLAYYDNASFDSARKGYFSVQDLANAMARQVANLAVTQAIAKAYAMRPGERMRDPVYGDDFAAPSVQPYLRVPLRAAQSSGLLATLGALTLAGAAGYAAYRVRDTLVR